MFQLYKKRDFSALIGDTFSFFKLEGKNYFKNYFSINGGLLLLLVVIIYFFSSIFIKGVFASAQIEDDEALINEIYSNFALFIGFGFGMILLITLISIINYSFPIAYLKLIEEKKERNFQNIIAYFKSKIGRIIVFYLLSLVVLIPLLFIIVILTFLSIFILIGIPLIFLLVPTLTSFVALSYYHYITENIGYFNALGKSYEMLKNKFWPIIGSTFIIHMIIQITLGIMIMIPYVFGIITLLSNPEMQQNPENAVSFFTIFIVAIVIISIIFNYTLQNLILINQGVIFYSCKEESENISVKNSIDLIGTDEA
jgi:hypothetical protein